MKKKIIIFCITLAMILLSACENQCLENVQNDSAKDNVGVENQLDAQKKEQTIQSEYFMLETQENINVEYWNVISDAINENIIPVDADVLYSYGNAFAGETVLTAFRVSDTMYDLIRYTAPHNNDDTFVSIVANFENREEMEFVEEDEVVAVVGIIKKNYHENRMTVTITDSQIIAVGVEAQIIKEEIKLRQQKQQEYAKSKGVSEPIVSLPVEISEDKYRSECKGFLMSKVVEEYENVGAISFNKYNEAKVWFYGTIMQKIELSNTTNAYIIEHKGECWYAVHTTSETEEISIGENIRVYGECIGVKTYDTVYGEKKTIPVMRLKYFEKL